LCTVHVRRRNIYRWIVNCHPIRYIRNSLRLSLNYLLHLLFSHTCNVYTLSLPSNRM
jgi:hypothetical protein